MDEDLTRDYLMKSDFSTAQADALSRLLAQTATRADLDAFKKEMRTEMSAFKREMRLEMGFFRKEVQQDLRSLKREVLDAIQASASKVRTDIMRWVTTMLIALATLMTLVDVFVD